MKKIAEQTDKNKIDWNSCSEFIKGIFPKMKSDLEEKLGFLKTIKPYLLINEYPPRIELEFISKCATTSFELFPNHERELKRNLSQISLKITEIANEYNLEVTAGKFIVLPEKRKRVRVYSRDLGEYTFKPKYKEFAK